MTPLEEILRKSLTNTAKQFFPFLHCTPSHWWKTRKWLVMRQQIKRSKRSDGRKTQHIYSTDLNGSHYLNTTQSVADRQTGSDVGCVWGGQLYRDVRCLLGVVSRFPHKPAIRWQGSSSRIRTSVQEGGLTYIKTKLFLVSCWLEFVQKKALKLWCAGSDACSVPSPIVSDVLSFTGLHIHIWLMCGC